MSAKPTGGPAWPCSYEAEVPYSAEARKLLEESDLPEVTWRTATMTSTGMSLRDWFAGQAIPQNRDVITAVQACWDPPAIKSLAKDVAEAAYYIADAMLAEREK